MTFTRPADLPEEIFLLQGNEEYDRFFVLRYQSVDLDVLGETNGAVDFVLQKRSNIDDLFAFYQADATVKETKDFFEVPDFSKVGDYGYFLTQIRGLRRVNINYFGHAAMFVVDEDRKIQAVYYRNEQLNAF